MCTRSMGRSITLAFGAAALLGSSTASMAASPRIERHFVVNGRPVVVIQNVANGRIEVKSSKSQEVAVIDRKSTRLNSSHVKISYAVFCLKKKKKKKINIQ